MTEDQGFRIIDKRRFTEGAAKEEAAPAQNFSSPEIPGSAGSAQPDSGEQFPAIDFSSLIVIYATQAMTLLGEIPEPQSGQFMTPDLPAARHTIDIVALLQEKTAGNLSPEEAKLIQDVLTKLRLAFVGKAREPHR